jgi:cell wall-associated NlpC family hydrolase
MDRRALLERAGAVLGAVAVAGCGSVAIPDELSSGSADDSGSSATEASTQRPDPGAQTDGTSAPRTTDRPTVDPTARSTPTRRPTARPTTTAAPRTETALATPEPPANRLLRADEVGDRWRYRDAPTEHGNGTITAVYGMVREPSAKLRTRLWPCEGESLANLGGTCSLGNLPERYRAMEGVETATPAVGETAFAWWAGAATDIEVVANDHVFRMTYTTPGPSAVATGGTDNRNPVLRRLTRLARRQVDKLGTVS